MCLPKRFSFLLLLFCLLLASSLPPPTLGDIPQQPLQPQELPNPYGSDGDEILLEEPNGPVDFAGAELQPDGSLCVTKTKMVQKMEKQQVKECWHQNITQCHETYVTEFKPNQEQQCEENFWKSCKITFRDKAYNYTLRTCSTPLVKNCDEYGYGQQQQQQEHKMVCKTWYESTCNTTYAPVDGSSGDTKKPQTWCSKEPRKICAPDNCRMEPGEEVCHDKTLESTVQKPEEVCDLQPQTQCQLVTNMVPHLEAQTVCKDIPKEVCHLKLDNPRMISQPVKLKWCAKGKPAQQQYVQPPPPQEQYAQPQQYNQPQQPQQYQQNQQYQQQQQQPYAAPAAPAKPTASPPYYKPSTNGRQIINL